MSTQNTILYTDGSSLGNPGPGGWGVIIKDNEFVRELGGSAEYTTNNKMELFAAIEGLRLLKSGTTNITLHTDSSYVINGITKWIYGWQKNGWKTASKKPVENRDLWEALFRETRDKKITWKHVRGHSGIAGNERADCIAQSFASGEPEELFVGKKQEYFVEL